MKLLVGRIQIELLESAPSYEEMPQSQADTYRLFMELAHAEESQVKAQTLLEQLGLKSLLPLVARIEHLHERGLIRLKKYLVAAT
jgi:hypothetical protein